MKKVALFASLCVSVGLLYGCGSDKEKEKPVEPKKETVEKEQKQPVEESKYYMYQEENTVFLLDVKQTKSELQVKMKTTVVVKDETGKKNTGSREVDFTGTVQDNGDFKLQSEIGLNMNGKFEDSLVKLELPDKQDKNKNIWYSFKQSSQKEYNAEVEKITK